MSKDFSPKSIGLNFEKIDEVVGKTYYARELLKMHGFKWDGLAWTKYPTYG